MLVIAGQMPVRSTAGGNPRPPAHREGRCSRGWRANMPSPASATRGSCRSSRTALSTPCSKSCSVTRQEAASEVATQVSTLRSSRSYAANASP